MKTLSDIDNTIDALKEVSSNALLKHGFSRSRQRIFDLSKSLDQTWQDYKAIHGKTYYKELCLFVICHMDFLICSGMLEHQWVGVTWQLTCAVVVCSIAFSTNHRESLHAEC